MQTHPKLSLIEHFKDLADPRIDRTKEHDLINTSIKSCSLVRSIRGSARSLKCSMRLSLGCVCIPFHLNTFSKSTSAKMAHPQLSFQRFLDASALVFLQTRLDKFVAQEFTDPVRAGAHNRIPLDTSATAARHTASRFSRPTFGLWSAVPASHIMRVFSFCLPGLTKLLFGSIFSS